MRTQVLTPTDLISPTKTSIVARTNVYSDLDLLFKPNPVTGDINPIEDAEAIKRSVMNLISTNFYERPFQPEIGSGIRGLLFELADPITMHDIESAIIRTLKNFEPRVTVLEVQIVDNSDMNEYEASLTYRIIASDVINTATIILERLR